MGQFDADIPLGREVAYPEQYAPELLFAIDRSAARAELNLSAELPFKGVDIWNAYELSWLNPQGLPQVACAELSIPCDSPAIVESKSIKLYLNSLNHKCFTDRDELQQLLVADLSACIGVDVAVRIYDAEDSVRSVGRLGGDCLDGLDVSIDCYHPDASLLQTGGEYSDNEQLHSHLFRSLCPVTAQPDWASVFIAYSGRAIDRASLLKYLVSFRQHQGFHEQCVERIFLDLSAQCQPEQLTVYARFLRRGGLDINPLRCSTTLEPENIRLWRQ